MCYREDLVDGSPFYTQDTARSHLCGCGANRSGRSDSRRCTGRSWHHRSPAVPCTGGTPWGRPSSQGCGTSYSAATLQIEAKQNTAVREQHKTGLKRRAVILKVVHLLQSILILNDGLNCVNLFFFTCITQAEAQCPRFRTCGWKQEHNILFDDTLNIVLQTQTSCNSWDLCQTFVANTKPDIKHQQNPTHKCKEKWQQDTFVLY